MYAVPGMVEQGSTRRKLVLGHWHKSATQAVAHATNTLVSWDVENEDDYNLMGTPGTSATIPVGLGGRYLIYGSITWAHVAGGTRHVYVQINGSVVAHRYAGPSSNGANFAQEITVVRNLGPGATVAISANQDTGSSVNLLGTAVSGLAGSSAFNLVRLGDA